MEARQSSVTTLRPAKGLAAFNHTAASATSQPLGLGAPLGQPTLGIVPGSRLRRQATLAKGYGHMKHSAGPHSMRAPPPAALPLFDLSVAVIDSLNLMRASVEEEVVLQSALGVPAHHALACRIEAYGTPFAAPALRAARGAGGVGAGAAATALVELSEDDKQFAACLATPPDFDAAGSLEPAMSLQRMASLSVLQRADIAAAVREARGGGGGAAAAPELAAAAKPSSAAARADGGNGNGGTLLRMPSVQVDKKDKRVQALTKGGGAGDNGEADAAEQAGGAGGAAWPSVSTPEGRAALAALAREASARGQWQLFHGCGDAVAALVGCGCMLLRAARFSRSAPTAVEALAGTLRRMASLPSSGNGLGGHGVGGGGLAGLQRALSGMPPVAE